MGLAGVVCSCGRHPAFQMLPRRSNPMPLWNLQGTHPVARPGRRWPRCGFSLIELLVVLMIVSVMLVIAVPAFSNASNQARRASKEIIKAHLRQARAHAITTGHPTAVAIPSLDSGPELGGRSLSLFEVEPQDGGFVPRTSANGRDRMLQRREVLPGDFHLVPAAAIGAATPTLLDQPASLVTDQGGQPLTCHLVVFSTDGRAIWPPPGTPINIAIARATRRGGSLLLTERSGGRPVFELFQINRLTGRTRPIEP